MSAAMIETTYREAVREAIRDAIRRDPRVFLMGEDVGRYGGCYAVSKGLYDEFGPERIRDTPLSESGFTGAGIGAAMGGMRPIVEIMTVNFSLLALDQIVNNAATLRHMSGGQFNVPVVIRMACGAGRQLAAQHSHSLENWYAHIPGIKVVAPATLEDARGMLWTALEDPDPVVIFEHVMLYNRSGPLAADAGPVPIAGAAVRRAGSDVTLITYGGSLYKTLEAAEALALEGIAAEVIDLRSLRPLDDATVMASVSKTHRAVIVDEGWRSGSLAAEVSARIMEQAFWELDAPVGRVCSAEVPDPLPQAPGGRRPAPGPRHRRRRKGDPRPMSALYRMPSLGSDMEAGTLIQWVKQPGERFAKGDVIAVVETQKGAIEVEVFHAGTMGRLLVEPGQRVPVGTPMAELEVEGATAPVGPAETEPVPPGESAVQPATGHQPMPPQPLPRHSGRMPEPSAKEGKPSVGTEPQARAGPTTTEPPQPQPTQPGRCAPSPPPPPRLPRRPPTGSAARPCPGRPDRQRPGRGHRPGRCPPNHHGSTAGRPADGAAVRPPRPGPDRHARGHRRRHGPLKARNPALLSEPRHRPDPGQRLARPAQRRSAAGPPHPHGRALHQGGRPDAPPLP